MRTNLSLLTALCIASSLVAVEAPPATTPEISTNAIPTNPTDLNRLAEQQPELSTFVSLITASQLRDMFNGTGPFTVFAPSNEAFEKLGKEKVESLKKPENRDALADIILYHFVPGKYMSKNLKSNSYATLEGKKVTIEVENGIIKVNGAKVIKTDLSGRNGTIHVVDTVLLPK